VTSRRPLVSVIIPTFNRADKLREALDSVYAQEGVDEHFEMEVIVVDDASSDATPKVVQEYPLRYVRLERNAGVSAARNAGIRASAGTYIAMLDDDDLWLPHRLKAHIPHLETRPDVGVAYGQVLVTGDGPDALWPDADRAPSGDAFRALLMEEFIIPVHVIVRRDAFERAGYFDETLRTMEHHEMYLRLSRHVPFLFLPGAVAIGRFSRQGKWFTNIAAGNYQIVAPMIVERGLAHVPSTADVGSLRRQAALSWFSQIAYWIDQTGQVELLRRHVLGVLAKNPWMLGDAAAHAAVTQWTVRLACLLAASSSPSGAVRALDGELGQLAEREGEAAVRALRPLRAELWTEVSAALVAGRCARYRRAAAIAMARGVLNSPRLLRHRYVLKTLIRGVLADPRWDSIIAWTRRKDAP
jgi:Glycosyl transferase family 2